MKKLRLTLRELRRRSPQRSSQRSVQRSVPSADFSPTADELAHWLPSSASKTPVADLRAAHASRTLEHTNSLIC